MEASTHGVPAISVSLQVTRGEIKFHDGHVDVDFRHSEKILNQVVEKIIKKGLPDGVDFINLNIPSHPSSNKIKLTRLGERMYRIHIKKRLDPRGRPYYWIDGDPIENDDHGTDVNTLKFERCATITPISLDCTSNLEIMDGWLD